MPEIKLVDDPTDSFKLKNAGVTVVMRRHATAADIEEAKYAAFAEGFTPRHTTMKFLKYLAASLVVSWDAVRTNEKGEPEQLPITPQTLAAIKDQDDYKQLLNEAALRLDARGEQDAENFDQSSSPSSEDTN